MLSQLKFTNTLSRIMLSKVTLLINLLLIINYVWNIARTNSSTFMTNILIAFLVIYNLVNIFIAYLCSKYYCKISNDILELNTFGIKCEMDLRKSDYYLIHDETNILKLRLSGISINDMNFGVYSLKNNYGKSFAYSTIGKGAGIILTDGYTKVFLRTDNTKQLIARLQQQGKSPSDLKTLNQSPITTDNISMYSHMLCNSILVVLSIIVLHVWQNYLPEQIPVHWNYAGEINLYWTKNQFIANFPLAVLCFNLLYCFYCARHEVKTVSVYYLITFIYFVTLGVMLFIMIR